jgi:serine/threonine-protein kinase
VRLRGAIRSCCDRAAFRGGEAAKRSLRAHHCSLGKVKKAFSSKVKKGRVISQKPKAGRHLRHGAKVNLTVSKGKKS